MLGSVLIIVFTLICIALEVLIGRKRGVIMNGIRLGFTVIGTVVAACLSNAIAMSVLKAIAGDGKGAIDMTTLVDLPETVSPVAKSVQGLLAGISLSVLVPVIFGILFIILKLLTLILYIIFKTVIKKTSIGPKLMNTEQRWNRIAGAVLGGFVAVYSIALFALPISGIAGMLEEWTDSIEATANSIDSTVLSKADLKKVTNGVETISDAFGSASVAIYKYTGANALAGGIYRSVSEINLKKAGFTGLATESVSFPEFLDGLLADAEKLVDPLNEVVSTFEGDGEVDITKLDLAKLTDSLREIADVVVFDGKLIADEDKLMMINALVPTIKDSLKSAVTVADISGLVHTYSSMADFRNGFDSLMDAVEKLANVNLKTDESGQIKWDETIRDKDNLSAVVDTLAVMSTQDSEGVKQIINETAASLITEAGGSEGETATDVTQYLEESVLDNIEENKEDIVNAISIATEIADYYDESKSSDLTEEDVEKKIDEIEKLGIVTPEAIEELRKNLGM